MYKVSKIPDGRSYLTRFITVTQEGANDICFTCTCSFKKPESNLLDLQEKMDLWQQYKPALEGKGPQDFIECHGVDIPWYWELRERTGYNDEFPGLQTTKVNVEPYNKNKNPLDRRELMFYRAWGPLPSNPNIHLCAHLYASDRNSLYLVCNLMDVGDLYTSMSSLVHSTSFHGDTENLLFGPSHSNDSPLDDANGFGRWFCREDSTTRSASGRAMFNSRVWSANGTHVASLMQDGMIRYAKKPKATQSETAALQDRKRKWKPKERL